MMNEPNFFIIGAQKAGTTSLYFQLHEHDQIYMSPIKEPKYFSLLEKDYRFNGPGDHTGIQENSVDDWDEYLGLFKQSKDETAIGEASTWYLYDPLVPRRINQVFPRAKLIAVLRNPVDRAFSAFLHLVRERRESCQDFECGLNKEEQRIANNYSPLWHYKSVGFYYQQLERYYALFPENQILVIIYEQYRDNPRKSLEKITEFLEVEPFKQFTKTAQHNISGIPKSKTLDNLISNPNPIRDIAKLLIPKKYRRSLMWKFRSSLMDKPRMDPGTRNDLISLYETEIRKLEQMLDTNLEHWLKV